MTLKAADRDSATEKFRSWLTKKHLTLEQFSRETDIHFSTAMKWFTGENGPGDLAKYKIGQKFPGCPLAK